MSYVVLPNRSSRLLGVGADTFAKESGELEDLPVGEGADMFCSEGLRAVQVKNKWGHLRTVACVKDCPEGFKELTSEWCVTPEDYNESQTVEKIAIAEKKHRIIKTAAWGAGAAALLAFLL